MIRQANQLSQTSGPTTAPNAGGVGSGGARQRGSAPLLPVFSLVLWVSCLAVGLGGMLLHYPAATSTVRRPEPVAVEVIDVSVAKEPTPQPDVGPAPSREAPVAPSADDFKPPPPLPAAAVDVAPPPLAPVAVLTPATAAEFARPVDGPATKVEPRQAAPVQDGSSPASSPSGPGVADGPAVPKRLTFGVGEGRQAAPEYPRESVIGRQQGTVVVRMTVGPDGRVTSADAVVPCPYPLLNQAAVRRIHETWQFVPGAVRVFEVSIQFELKKR